MASTGRRAMQRPVTVVVQGPQSAGQATSSDFSAVAGRILDQLSATAWLPAALLVGDIALAVAYSQAEGKPDERWASILASLNAKPFGVILAVAFALVLATIVTQSFEFVAIRFLEGYWGTSLLGSGIASAGIGIQRWRRRRLTDLGSRLEHKALVSVIPLIHLRFVDEPLVATAVERRVLSIEDGSIDEKSRARAMKYLRDREWLSLVKPALAHRIYAVDSRSAGFPDEDRMMPTRLGLVLRTTEDRLVAGQQGENLRGFVIGNLHQIDPATLQEHDQYRNRLDMYSVLCFVTATLAVLNLAILAGEIETGTLVLLTASMLLLGWASYRGTLTTAEDYGTVLAEIDRRVNG